MSDITKFPIISMNNKTTITQSNNVGCYSCLKIYPKEEVITFTDMGKTGVCPHCLVDTIVGDSCGFTLNEEILTKAKKYWFDQTSSS